MNKTVMFSSSTAEWATPDDFWKAVDREFHFTLDLAAAEWNAKTHHYFSADHSVFDHLNQIKNQVCWCNPVYGDGEQPCKPRCHKAKCVKRGYHVGEQLPGIMDFVEAAIQLHHQSNTVIMLPPARTDTAWWALLHKHADEIRLIRGRLHFKNVTAQAVIDPDEWPVAADGLPVVKPSRLAVRPTTESVTTDPAPFPSALVVLRPRPAFGDIGTGYSLLEPSHYMARWSDLTMTNQALFDAEYEADTDEFEDVTAPACAVEDMEHEADQTRGSN